MHYCIFHSDCKFVSAEKYSGTAKNDYLTTMLHPNIEYMQEITCRRQASARILWNEYIIALAESGSFL